MSLHQPSPGSVRSDNVSPDSVTSGGRVEIDVLVAGTIFCDLVFASASLPAPGTEVFAEAFTLTAGATATRAVAAARLGARTGLLGVLGTDVFGDRVGELLAGEPGLDLRWVSRSPTVHTALSVGVTNADDRSFITYEEPGTTPPPAWPGELPTVGVAHVGLADPLPDWVPALRAAGTTIVGGVGWDPSQTWSGEVLDRLGEVDVFVPNEIEACRYTGTDTAEEAVRILAERVRSVVVTRGGAGALAADAGTGEWVDVPTVPVEVADPTGAGDVFVGALMVAGLASQDASHRGQTWDLATRVRFASLAASLSVRSLGGTSSAPRPADLLALLRDLAGAGAAEAPTAVSDEAITAWAAARAA